MGILPEVFWRLEPYEFFVMQKGYYKKQIRERNLYMFGAYWSGYFGRVKDFPALKDFLEEEDLEQRVEQKEQTPEQMFTVIQALNTALGGKVVVHK